MIAKKLWTSAFCCFLTYSAVAGNTLDYSPWAVLGNGETDFTPILQELEIENLEGLSPEDPKFNAFMDKVKERNAEAVVNESLQNTPIKIVGFIAPLQISDVGIETFLLVPYEGACIHVPAPPVNQTVLVVPKDPIPMEFYYEAISVEGTIFVDHTETELAQAGYRMEANRIEVIPIEQVFEYL